MMDTTEKQDDATINKYEDEETETTRMVRILYDTTFSLLSQTILITIFLQ